MGICTDGAQTMAGKRGGLQALMKRVAPEAQWTHYIIHRVSPTLNDVLSEVVIVVNYIKTTEPLKSALITLLCCFTVKRDGSPAAKCCPECQGTNSDFSAGRRH